MLALLFYWDALNRSRGFWWTALFTGLAVMTKGMIGLMPYGIIVLFLLLSRTWTVLRSGRLWLAILVTILIALPWHAAMIGRHGETFVRIYFWQTQLSFISGTHHVDPWHWSTILRKVAENYWPWLLALVPSLIASAVWFRRHPREDSEQRGWVIFLWIWFAAIFVFFHLTYVKRHQYILPAYPAMAFLCAWGLMHVKANWRRWLLAAVTLFVCAAMVVAIVTPLWPRYMDNNLYGDKLGAIRFLAGQPELSGTLFVLDDDTSYCFNCDTIAYYTQLQAFDYDRDRIGQEFRHDMGQDFGHDFGHDAGQESSAGGQVLVLALTSLREQLATDLPPGWFTITTYEDGQVAIFTLIKVE